MSLKEKWEEYRTNFEKKYPAVRMSSFKWAIQRRAFYAGAEAVIQATERDEFDDNWLLIQAEIDRLKGQK